MKFSSSVLVSVFLYFVAAATSASASASVVDAITPEDTSGGPGRHRRTLSSKKNSPSPTPCLAAPLTETFSGTSITASSWPVKTPFETCWQRGDAAKYCWSRSQCSGTYPDYGCYGCVPKGGTTAAEWLPVETEDVVNSCDAPCQELF